MIVGEAPGREEEAAGEPFLGASGKLLTSLLQQVVGITRTSCFITNVCRHRPPGNDISEWLSDNKRCPKEHPDWHQWGDKWVDARIADGIKLLHQEIEQVRPQIILALGNTALWALSGYSGIGKWRGSRIHVPHIPCPIIPAFHPAAILRQMELLPVLKMDLKRLKAVYEGRQVPRQYDFQIEPEIDTVLETLHDLITKANQGPLLLAGDLETRKGHIACFGIAWSETEALCIPFLRDKGFYWPLEEEAVILDLLWLLFRHPNITWTGQNYLYDCQYFHRFWHVLPLRVYDTMIGHHSTFSTMRKGLDFLSSMHAQDHIYWKDESKNWAPDLGEKQLWTYNCKDCCITYEITPKIQQTAAPVRAHHDFQQSLFFPVLRIMLRGIRIDKDQRKALRSELLTLADKKQSELDFLAGHNVNPRSNPQLLRFFYTDFKLPGIRSMKSEGLTADSQALKEISIKEPILQPICQRIAELRSIGVFLSTFIEADLDTDGRMRCSFAVAGTHSFRFTSSENAFGSGLNFQNIPIEAKNKLGADKYVQLPNIRKLFIPDEGKEFFDLDLDRADLQVVVWEADDADMKKALRLGLDMHCFSACEIFDIKGIPYEELAESHPNYKEHRGRIGYDKRQKAKIGVHATNYGVGDYKLSISLGISVKEAGVFRGRWFASRPGIRKWHLRTEEEASKKGYTENKFGARLYHLGRFDLPEALAWTPQSTVAGVINRGLLAIDSAQQAGECDVELLLQVHDSLGGQYPISRREHNLAALQRLSRIVVPYDDPLIIPTGIKTSSKSWGDCK